MTDLTVEVPFRPPHNPRGLDLELNSGLRGERLTFCRLTVVPDALCMVQRGIPTSTNNFSLHHSSRNANAFCALLDSHAAPTSPLTATAAHNNWLCQREAGYWPNLTLQRFGFASGPIHVTLVVGEVSL